MLDGPKVVAERLLEMRTRRAACHRPCFGQIEAHFKAFRSLKAMNVSRGSIEVDLIGYSILINACEKAEDWHHVTRKMDSALLQ